MLFKNTLLRFSRSTGKLGMPFARSLSAAASQDGFECFSCFPVLLVKCAARMRVSANGWASLDSDVVAPGDVPLLEALRACCDEGL